MGKCSLGPNKVWTRPLCTGSGLLLALYGAAVMAVPMLAGPDPAEVSAKPCPAQVHEQAQAAVDEEAMRALAGIWWRWQPQTEGDPVRFYYFHGDGTGLYRYGQAGLTNTHSFDYRIEDGQLSLRFRKTGREHAIVYRVEQGDDGRDWLTLETDPEETQSTRYFRERPGPIEEHAQTIRGELGPAPAGHMWIDLQRYATGGMGFHFYQLRPAGIDGRGVGWFHRGDFDDWSTESLVYRITGDRIELWFPLSGERTTTTFRLDGRGKDRSLWLAADPRDFGHHHRYRDAGPSFGQLSTPSAPDLASDLARIRELASVR